MRNFTLSTKAFNTIQRKSALWNGRMGDREELEREKGTICGWNLKNLFIKYVNFIKRSKYDKKKLIEAYLTKLSWHITLTHVWASLDLADDSIEIEN